MSEYIKQAQDFLKATQTTFTARFKHYGTMPGWEDGKSRDVFNVTLRNSKHKFRFTFGQSLSESTGDGDNKPSAYDILTCLTKSDPGTFENFCSEFGYDTDSRKAFKTYKAVMREFKNVELLFTEEELNQLQFAAK